MSQTQTAKDASHYLSSRAHSRARPVHRAPGFQIHDPLPPGEASSMGRINTTHLPRSMDQTDHAFRGRTLGIALGVLRIVTYGLR